MKETGKRGEEKGKGNLNLSYSQANVTSKLESQCLRGSRPEKTFLISIRAKMALKNMAHPTQTSDIDEMVLKNKSRQIFLGTKHTSRKKTKTPEKLDTAESTPKTPPHPWASHHESFKNVPNDSKEERKKERKKAKAKTVLFSTPKTKWKKKGKKKLDVFRNKN